MSEGMVLVAGAGAAGLAAALAAAKGGREVVLIERSPRFRQGSNTAMSTAMIPAAGSRWQQDAGIPDSPEVFRADIARKTKGTASMPLAEALTNTAPALVSWLADECGLPLALVTDFNYPGHSFHRCHTLPERSGRAMHEALLRAAEAEEAITMIVPMELAGLVRASEGFVATLRSPDGDVEEAEFSDVVLATNGFGADPDLIARHIPGMTRAHYHGSDGSTGDALRIGEALGADVAYLDAFQGHGSLITPHAVLLTWAVIMHGGIVVNSRGERFGDETTGYSEYGPLVMEQPGGTAWVVFDERIGALCESFADYADALASHALKRAESVDELAHLIGCPTDAIAEELAAAHRRHDAGVPDRYGRRDDEMPPRAPFLAAHITGALFHTQGGLVVDDRARVLSGGEPIAGLYAAGGAAHGISGHGADGYLAGNGLLAALGLGYLAGQDLAGRDRSGVEEG